MNDDDYRQRNLVLSYLKTNGSITSQIAWKEFGITRLSAVIYRLRKLGFEIITVSEEGTNRYGNPCRYARYVMVAEQ